MDRMQPLVTVGMPVFNGEAYISNAIESVLSQTFTDFELLISDNASTDATALICRSYAAKEKRVRFVEQDKNRGAYWNFKYVTDHAVGSLLVWLAHDDTLDERFIEETVSHMNQNAKVVVVCSDLRVVDDSGAQIGMEELVDIRESIDSQKRCSEFYKYPISNVYFGIYGMMRTNVCRVILGEIKPPRYMAQIELPILARFAAEGEIVSLPLTLRTYRRHCASLYLSEVARLSGKSLNRTILRHARFARLRFDQMTVLVSSILSRKIKVKVLSHVAKHYYSRLISKLR